MLICFLYGNLPAEPISQAFLDQEGGRNHGPSPLRVLLEIFFLGYGGLFSPVDGPSCPFHPTCSQYAKQALRMQGLMMGVLMSGDRLMRCNGSGHTLYPKTGPGGALSDPPVFEVAPDR